MSDPLVSVERGVPLAWIHMRRRYLVAITALILLLVFAIAMARLAWVRLGEVETNQHAAICRAKINAKFFTGVADAFLAPPAPNPARTIAASEIRAAAAQLHNTEKVCGS